LWVDYITNSKEEDEMKIKLILASILILSGLLVTNAAPVDDYNFSIDFYYRSGSSTEQTKAMYIREALKPLGINVELYPLPWGSFIGKLLHYTEYNDFDMATVRFSGTQPTPSFMWAYHTTQTSFGQDTYELHLPEWQEWQLVDVGVDHNNVDQLLEDIDNELDLNTKKSLIDQFNELYMTKLLYDYPLYSRITKTSMWKGYGGENNELWNPDLGALESRMLGATWTSFTPPERASNNTHMRLSTVTPGRNEMFDPNQSFDSATEDITRYMHDELLCFDEDEQPHPGIAWNWYFRDSGVYYDHDNNAGTPDVNTYEIVYFLRDDAMWTETIDRFDTIIPSEAVDAQDFVLALDMYKHPQTVLYGKEQFFEPVLDYFSSTSITTDDTFTIRINADLVTSDDYYTYGHISPVPAHILGGNLTDGFQTNMLTDFADWNPQDSYEWIHWASIDGHSLAGAYDIVKYVSGEYYSYSARDDYYYPNEDDVNNFYNAVALSTIETDTGFDLSVFAPHMNTIIPVPLYWAWNSPAKPTSQGIETFEFVVIDDINAQLIQFESGNLDAVGTAGHGALVTLEHEENPNFAVKSIILQSGPDFIVFGKSHPDLKKFNVRLAIAHALDKDLLSEVHDGLAVRHDSIVWRPNGYYYDDSYGINYNLEYAKSLMVSEGYTIPSNEISSIRDQKGLGELDTNLDTGTTLPMDYVHEEIIVDEIPVVVETDDFNSLIWLSSILLFVPIVILKRKY
jgi:hypothetical protein